jgi:probable HAF family extracellular repeat protein
LTRRIELNLEEQMMTRHLLSAPRGGSWKPWVLGPAVALAAASWGGGHALAHPQTAPAPTTTTYRIIPLWESNSITQPEINNSNQVAFSVAVQGDFPARAKFYDGRQVHDIGTLGGAESTAFSVNDLGQVVGSSLINPANNFHAFLWSQRTGIIDLGALPPAPGGSAAFDINNGGQAVGVSQVMAKTVRCCGAGGPASSTSACCRALPIQTQWRSTRPARSPATAAARLSAGAAPPAWSGLAQGRLQSSSMPSDKSPARR